MKILVILSRVPFPLEKGDKLRAFHQLAELHQRHELIVCCFTDATITEESEQELGKICSEYHIFQLRKSGLIWQLFLSFWSNKPFQVAYFYRYGIHKAIKSIIASRRPDHIFCQLIRTAEYAKDQHAYPKTLDYQDAFSKGMARRMDNAPWYSRWIFRIEMNRLKIYENIIFEFFENKIIISQQDRDFIFHHQRQNISIIPNGIDGEYFMPISNKSTRYTLLFTGNMSYSPNVDCVRFLVREILPLVHVDYPEVTLLIAGANPANAVKQLAGKLVTVSGWIPDIRNAYNDALIFLAPMQMGSGLQNKLLEAMAMEMPCITSTIANNALGATPNKEVLIGNSPAQYARQISRLLESPELRSTLAIAGRKYVIDHFDWKRTTRQLEAIITRHEPNALKPNID